jgi:hypothetical protein
MAVLFFMKQTMGNPWATICQKQPDLQHAKLNITITRHSEFNEPSHAASPAAEVEIQESAWSGRSLVHRQQEENRRTKILLNSTDETKTEAATTMARKIQLLLLTLLSWGLIRNTSGFTARPSSYNRLVEVEATSSPSINNIETTTREHGQSNPKQNNRTHRTYDYLQQSRITSRRVNDGDGSGHSSVRD